MKNPNFGYARPTTLVDARDLLAPLGVTITDQHLPPARILELAGMIEPDS